MDPLELPSQQSQSTLHDEDREKKGMDWDGFGSCGREKT